MKQRRYGNTGKWVSEIGFGAWQLGNQRDWEPMADEAAIRLVHTALDAGCNFFDTAPGYGGGRSEQLLGEALKGRRHEVVLNTKFGHTPEGKSDFRPEALRTSIEGSLQRLQTDYLDSVLLHNPPYEFLGGQSPLYPVLEALREEGKILAYGASVDSARDLEEALTAPGTHAIELLFNIFHQEPMRAFQALQHRDVAVIVKVPLDSGWLSGKYSADTVFTGVRKRWSADVIAHRLKLLEQIRFVETPERTLAQAALQFVLAHPEVTTVIPGTRDEAQLFANIHAADHEMDDATVRRLHEFWAQQIGVQGVPW